MYSKYISIFFNIIRIKDWWSFKVPTLLAVTYATIYIAKIDLSQQLFDLGLLFFYISNAAIYVSIINDVYDQKIDYLASKNKLITNLSPKNINYLIIFLIFIQLLIVYSLKNKGLTVLWYFLSIFSYSLYSIYPIRLKENKYLSVMLDALGAHAFPSMAIIAYISYLSPKSISFYWSISIFIWSFLYGIRGIVWHQFYDKKNDIISKLKTLATDFNEEKLNLILKILISIEFVFLILIMTKLNLLLLLFSLIIYIIIIYLRQLFNHSKIIIAIPKTEKHQLIFAEFYEMYLPITILMISIQTYQVNWFLIGLHILLVPKNIFFLIYDLKSFMAKFIQNIFH